MLYAFKHSAFSYLENLSYSRLPLVVKDLFLSFWWVHSEYSLFFLSSPVRLCALIAYSIDKYPISSICFHGSTLLVGFMLPQALKMVATLPLLPDAELPYASFVKLVWWSQTPPSLACPKRSLFLKDSLAGYRVLNCRLLCFGY